MAMAASGVAWSGSIPTASAAPPAEAGDLRMWYDEPAPDDNGGWIDRSIPMGNGALGVNLFGGVSRERLQLTENSLQDYDGDNVGGLNNFAEVYLDFPHTSPSAYSRDLVLDDGIAHVSYTNGGVDYEREVFASHDAGVVAVKLSASKPGKLSFTLRPEVPYLREDHAGNSNRGKTGTVTADGDTITMAGAMEYYDVRYEGQFRVIPTGGTMTASNPSGKGQIVVADADSAVVLIAGGTNYRMVPQVFSEPDRLKKLDGLPLPHDKVSAAITNATEKGYSGLRAEHLKYYHRLYGRVRLDLGGTEPTVPTDEVIDAARAGKVDPYLEELAFQFGRYLLISGSREGSLPLNLQGLWNVYEDPPWRSGYWHNVNLQMNYWPAFQTNLPETFRPYVEYNAAYLPVQQSYATDVIKQYQPSHLDPGGDNGWAMGNSNWPYKKATRPGHSGFGTGPWTAQLFWDYYDYTRDKELLRDVVYPVLEGQSNFLSRFVSDIDGKLLAKPSQSPENSGPETAGTTFDQQQIYENHRNTLAAAKLLGISTSMNPRLAIYRDQMAKLDPIVIGDSGQIKEYREETTYGSIGDPKHRHISQLLGLYPGQLVNSSTRAWLDAAKVSLDGRGPVGGTGWSQAQRIGAWARAQDGTKAYSFFTYWLTHHAMHNLWNNHRDSLTNQLFQVDGNFGVTAGVSEMLLQSHDGAVAPLAAIPAQWRAGSYAGLLARGGFEVSATWADSRATRLDVTSRAGGKLDLRYPGLNGAVVKDSRGRTVHYTGRSADEISLQTKKGQTYTVTSIPSVATVAAPSGLKVDADSGDQVKLTWTPSTSDSSRYNVYRAIGSDPTYRLLRSGLKETAFIDDTAGLSTAAQVTYRVAAVAPGGRVMEDTAPTVVRHQPSSAARVLHVNGDMVAYTGGDGTREDTPAAGGRYRVGFDWQDGNLTEIRLTAARKDSAVLRNEVFTRPVRVYDANGRNVTAQRSKDTLRFPVRAGGSYRIVPQVVVTASAPAVPVLPGVSAPVTVTVQARDVTDIPGTELTVTAPEGWEISPATQQVAPVVAQSKADVTFDAKAPAAAKNGTYDITASVTATGWTVSVPVTIAVEMPNYAASGEATQSSTLSDAGADRAIDGDTNGAYSAGSVSHTAQSPESAMNQPWWQVDLGAVKEIGAVNVWNRTDNCCVQRLNDFYVLVAEEPFGNDDLATLLQRGDVTAQRFTAPGTVPRLTTATFTGDARYVRVQLASTGVPLHLAEVEVYPPTPSAP
ncbi:glycosyl hydrolase family 95 catalytic domain-containing protein [Actinophytocola sp.]|uniref:glycosyl hydrolase family 95 catalytic domain-containing protein n=1 Tax=Actinophytocola sp. TaxID=1872138 RepID=UPI00389A4889